MDDIEPAPQTGRIFRALNIVDDFSREMPPPSEWTLRLWTSARPPPGRLCAENGRSQPLEMHNGPELTSRALDAWAYRNAVELRFIQAGKPVQNAYAESFNATLSRRVAADYDEVRPRSFLGDLTPEAH